MRLMHQVLLAGLLSTTCLVALNANAASVLVPSDSTKPGANGGGNLGLTPSAPSEPAKTDEPKDETPSDLPNTTPTITPPAMTNKLPVLPPATAALLPKPAPVTIKPGGAVTPTALKTPDQIAADNLTASLLAKGVSAQAAPLTGEMKKVHDWAEADRKKRFAMPPTFFDDNDLLAPDAGYLNAMPLAMDVTVSNKYAWDTKDVQSLERTLGYKPADVPQHCQLRLNVEMVSDKGRYNNRILAGDRTNVKFAGRLQAFNLMPWAVCDIPGGELPQNPTLIGKVGTNKYSVSVGGNATCPLPKGAVKSVEITYTGNSTVTCEYQ